MRLALIGTGYVGLVSGACFADFGHHVTCIDKDSSKIDALKAGRMPIWEPGLEGLVRVNVERGRLEFTTDLAEGIVGAEAVFIAVGTPARRGDGHADLTYVYAAVRELAKALERPVVLITKSTVPVGTGDRIAEILAEEGAPEGTVVASNPEFLREGAAIADFKHPDRIVVGAEDQRARDVLREIYRPLFLNKAPILFTGRRTAELTKYAANAFLAMKISFINEVADLCEAAGANVQEVATAIGADRRIGDKFLHPGPGYGGSCFPKDVAALIRTAREARSPLSLIEQVQTVNTERKIAMASRIERAAGGKLAGKSIAVLGITFKPDTDDVRAAPSLTLIPMLQEKGATVRAYDPHAGEITAQLLPGVTWCGSALEAVEAADVAVVVTEWNEFRALDLDTVKERMRGDVLVDLRNIYLPAQARAAGFSYTSIGRQ